MQRIEADLIELVASRNAAAICKLLKDAESNRTLFCSEDTIKNLLCQALPAFKDDETALKEIIVCCKNYTYAKDRYSHINHNRRSFDAKKIFEDGSLMREACNTNSSAIKFLIEHFAYQLRKNNELSHYLLINVIAANDTYAIELLSMQPSKLGFSVFRLNSLRTILNIAIKRSANNLVDAVCNHIEAANLSFQSIQKIFSVLEPGPSPLFTATKCNQWNFAIRMLEITGDHLDFNRETNTLSRRVDSFQYGDLLILAHNNGQEALARKLLEHGATMYLDTRCLPAPSQNNRTIFNLIQTAVDEEYLFCDLLSAFKRNPNAFGSIRSALKKGVSADCKIHVNNMTPLTPLIWASQFDTRELTPQQLQLFKNIVALLIEYGADVNQLIQEGTDFTYLDRVLGWRHIVFLKALLDGISSFHIDGQRIYDALNSRYHHLPDVTREIITKPRSTFKSQKIDTPAPKATSQEIKAFFTNFDKPDHHFDWNSAIANIKSGTCTANVTVAVGIKKIAFFDIADNAGLLDVFIRSLDANKPIPTLEQIDHLFKQGLSTTPVHSQSGLPLTSLVKFEKYDYIRLFLQHGASHEFYEPKGRQVMSIGDRLVGSYHTSLSNQDALNLIPVLFDRHVPFKHESHFLFIAEWLIKHAKPTDLTDKAINYLKKFKIEIWDHIKVLYDVKKVPMETMERMHAELLPNYKGTSVLRKVFWTEHADPNANRLKIILDELNKLVGKQEPEKNVPNQGDSYSFNLLSGAAWLRNRFSSPSSSTHGNFDDDDNDNDNNDPFYRV